MTQDKATIVEISSNVVFDETQNVYDILKTIKERYRNFTHLKSEIFKQLKCRYCKRNMSEIIYRCNVCDGIGGCGMPGCCVCGCVFYGGSCGWPVEPDDD